MNTFPHYRWWLIFALLHSTCQFSHARSAAEEMAQAAESFLNALTPEQRGKATFDVKSDERLNWHFIPKSRNGLPLKEMNPAQRHLAYALLNTGMSQRGFMKTTTIMSLEQVLHVLENNAPHRDAELYYFSIFGKPGAKATWAWRVEGHHLSLNFTVVGGKSTAVTPSFFGANPAEVRTGGLKGLRVMAVEEDLARDLVKSLSAAQSKKAIYDATAPRDIITAADRKAKVLTPLGLAANEMNANQRELLWGVIEEYVRRCRSDVADLDLARIRDAGPDKLTFAWAGSIEPGQGHYYRVQGPSFLLEYDNTQNNANHIHAVWRDLSNDFGEDLLRKHYDENPHP